MSTQLIQQERQLKVLSLMGLDTAQFEITQASAIWDQSTFHTFNYPWKQKPAPAFHDS